jgi:hypothetical protein
VGSSISRETHAGAYMLVQKLGCFYQSVYYSNYCFNDDCFEISSKAKGTLSHSISRILELEIIPEKVKGLLRTDAKAQEIAAVLKML